MPVDNTSATGATSYSASPPPPHSNIAPINISRNQDNLRKVGIAGWFESLSSPPKQPIARPIEPTNSSAIVAENLPGNLPIHSKRPRKDSSSMSHDEALNISRSGASPTSASMPAAFEGAINGPNSPQHQITTSPHQTRPRSNSKYDKLGLIAAYSGGPSSF